MKRYFSGLFIICLFFTACDQEPLFWDIAHEYPPIEPIIQGSPSRIVAATYPSPDPSQSKEKPVLYVSNGEIWQCDTNTDDLPMWQIMSPQPRGKIKTLAAPLEGYLFSLDWDGNIRKWDGTEWSLPLKETEGKPEQIFGAGNFLFAGARTGEPGTANGYCILAMEAQNSAMTMKKIKENTGLLSGAVYDGGDYFLGTQGGGIYKTNTPTVLLPDPPLTEGSSIIGIIKHDDKIVAITTQREIMYYKDKDFIIYTVPGFDFSGAIASWEYDGKHLLLLGLLNKSGSFGYGYRELMWDGGISVPGETEISSVERGSQFTSAIGNYGVAALYVLPPNITYKADNDERPVVYASTVKNGLWSYRRRGGRAQWNGEDNSR